MACTYCNYSAVWGTGADDVYIVGSTKSSGGYITFGIIFHLSGGSWSSLAPVPPNGYYGPLAAIWGSGTSTRFITSMEGEIIRNADRDYFYQYSALRSVWGSGPDDVYAVGYSTQMGAAFGMVFHRTGTSWNMLIPPSGMGNFLFNGIWGSGSTDIYVVGRPAVIYHGRGGSWVTDSQPGTSDLYAVWGTDPRNVYVVGDSGTVLRGR
jgi:hypothetical protein